MSVKCLCTRKATNKTTYVLVHGTMRYVTYSAFTNLGTVCINTVCKLSRSYSRSPSLKCEHENVYSPNLQQFLIEN